MSRLIDLVCNSHEIKDFQEPVNGESKVIPLKQRNIIKNRDFYVWIIEKRKEQIL